MERRRHRLKAEQGEMEMGSERTIKWDIAARVNKKETKSVVARTHPMKESTQACVLRARGDNKERLSGVSP